MSVTISPVGILKRMMMGLSVLKKPMPKDFLEKLGNDLADRIRKRVRLGYGCSSNGGARSKFNPLASPTVRFREYLKKRGQLVSFSSPKKSHLSATGKMMDNLGYKVSSGVVTILFSSSKEREKAEYNSKKRPFMFLTSSELTAAKKILEESVDSLVQETFV